MQYHVTSIQVSIQLEAQGQPIRSYFTTLAGVLSHTEIDYLNLLITSLDLNLSELFISEIMNRHCHDN